MNTLSARTENARPVPVHVQTSRRQAFGSVITARRIAMQLDAAELAYRAGLDQTTTWLIESGLCDPPLGWLFALADALDTDLTELLHESRLYLPDGISGSTLMLDSARGAGSAGPDQCPPEPGWLDETADRALAESGGGSAARVLMSAELR